MDFIFDPGLVLYLPLYELDGASFTSRDAYGHLCAVTGAVWTPQGRSFDGVYDFINCGNPVALQMANDFTVEVWISIATSQGGTYWDIISHGHSATGGWVWQATTAVGPNSLRALYGNGTDITGPAFTPDLRDGSFHHLISVKKSVGNSEVFVDGVYNNGSSRPLDIPLTGANVNIGRDSGGSRYVKGIIGEVRIYRRVLSPLEIQRNYLATKWRYR